MSFKLALDSYYRKLIEEYRQEMDTVPMAEMIEGVNPGMILSEPDEYGYVSWKPVMQEKAVNWRSIEEKLAIRIKDDLKSYFATYFFMHLDGIYHGVLLDFIPINGTTEIEKEVIQSFSDADYHFPGKKFFILGMAEYDLDDGYLLYYDNEAGRLCCYERNTGNYFALDSIETVVSEMEATI